VPANGGDGDDWTVVRVQRRKASGQVVRGQDKQRDFERQGGYLEGHYQQSRSRAPSPHNGKAFYGNPVNPNYQDERGTVWERLEFPYDPQQKQTDFLQTSLAGATITGAVQNASKLTGPAIKGTTSVKNAISGSENKRYVTFYFTNVPDMVPYLL